MQDAPIHGDGRWPHGNDDWRDSRRANAVDFTTAWMEMDEDEDDADDDDAKMTTNANTTAVRP